MSRRHAAIAVLAAVAMGVCVDGVSGVVATGAGRAPEVTAVPTTVAGAPVFDPVNFFGDFFFQMNADPHDPGDVPGRVVAGSPADAFVTYLLGFGAARLDSRQGPLEPFTVDRTTTPIEGSAAVDVCSDSFCDTFSDFVVTDGRLQTFLLNGLPIDDRLGPSTKAATFGPMDIRVVGAFERVTVDELAVVVAVGPVAEELAVAWDEVSYVNASGDVILIDLPASAYPEVIAPRTDGREQAVVLQFPTADLGGQLELTFTAASAPEPVEVSVTVDERT